MKKNSLRNTENIWVLGAFLCVTGLISALLLSAVNEVTKKPIAAAREKAFAKNLKLLVPDFDKAVPVQGDFKLETGEAAEFYRIEKDGKICAFVVKTSTKQGYAGKIEMLAALTPEGKILQLMVTDHKETPGLGAEVCARKFQKTIYNFTAPVPAGLPPNPLLDQYNGKGAETENWSVRKDGGIFDYRTGATVTSRALASLAGGIVRCYAANREKLCAEETK
ncbi:MAG: RnfABCDGE type electron transport complex subunit G [Victivallaceae bacterium]|nr:RnfABCDGE type electron transport complex subunit G [Victivallaceae bacterium]